MMTAKTIIIIIYNDNNNDDDNIHFQDKLDQLEQTIGENFYIWPEPKSIKKTNVYACAVECDDDDDEEEEEEVVEVKFHRARILRENDVSFIKIIMAFVV